MRSAARTSRRRCASSTAAAPASGSSTSCARSPGSRPTKPGVELGEVALDEPLSSLLHAGERRFRALPTPAAMTHPLFPFQERGHGWLRLLGDLGVGAILADDMGLGKTVQAIAMLASEREDAGDEKLGPTLVVCPMSVVKQWGAEIHRFAPSLHVHLHHGPNRLAARRARARRSGPRRRRHLLRHRHPRRRRARRDRLGPAAPRRGAGREEPGDEARAGAPAAAGAAQGGDDRDADREPARRALGDHGHRQPGPARLAGAVRPGVRAADRAVRRRGRARAAALDRGSVRAPPGEGLAGDRARAAADHDREGLLPADRRAGEPLPRDRRPLAGARRGARGPLRPPRRRARDARPPEAGLQPPGDAADDGPAARRPLRQARAPRPAARRRARPGTSRSSSRSTPASTASSRTSRSGSAAASASSTAG